MLERLEDGTYKKKNPTTTIDAIVDLQLDENNNLQYHNGSKWMYGSWGYDDMDGGAADKKYMITVDMGKANDFAAIILEGGDVNGN